MTTNPSWLQLSEQDSRRFGITIIRGVLERPVGDATRLADEVVTMTGDLAIVRVPAGDVALPLALVARGLTPIHADTLVYYERDACLPVRHITRDPSLLIEHAGESDRATLSTLATVVFGTYRSHYHANPRLDPKAIAEGYGEWATSCLIDSLSPEQTKRETWVVRQGDAIIAFATCALDERSKSTEILLNAVEPSHARQGIYGSLLRHLVDSYHQQGWAAVRISTQVWNYTVQRAWAREGFLLTHAFDTYHVPLGNHLAVST